MTGGLPPRVAVMGFGRFGRLWAELLRDDLEVVVHDPDNRAAGAALAAGLSAVPLAEALSAPTVFYCVPISAFEATLAEHAEAFATLPPPRTLIDVLSVKVHPRRVFDRLLPPGYSAMLTHPMFGPDSVAAGGLRGQVIVLDRYRMPMDGFEAWRAYFTSKGLEVVEMDADVHDRLAAASQGVTHFVGRTLERFGFAPTRIDTLGTRTLHGITAQVSNDTWQLFSDLQTHNPYTAAMRVRLSTAQNAVFDRLLPNRIAGDRLVVAIQGGRGSFNEEAARAYMARTPDEPYELVYLHTTEDVLRALHEGAVDRAQFAIHNSVGGMVEESVQAMARYRFAIVEEFAIKIAHALLAARGVDVAEIDTVMTHPQVLRQCRATLARKYPGLGQVSGEGELIDHARVAELLGAGALPRTTATMGSRILAELYALDVVEDDLQDLDENFTSFLWVQRP